MKLKEPYKFICKEGHNDYYYFNLYDSPYTYLAISANEQLLEMQKRFLRKKPKVIEHDIMVGLKLMPLNSLVLFFLYQATLLKINTYELGMDDEKINIYSMWDEYDLLELKKIFKKEMVEPIGTSNYDFSHTIHNFVARGYDRDGYMYIATENVNRLNRSYWLMRPTQYGDIHLVEVKEVGTQNKSVTTDVSQMLISRSVMEKIAKDLDDGVFEKEVSDIEYEELGEKDIVEVLKKEEENK